VHRAAAGARRCSSYAASWPTNHAALPAHRSICVCVLVRVLCVSRSVEPAANTSVVWSSGLAPECNASRCGMPLTYASTFKCNECVSRPPPTSRAHPPTRSHRSDSLPHASDPTWDFGQASFLDPLPKNTVLVAVNFTFYGAGPCNSSLTVVVELADNMLGFMNVDPRTFMPSRERERERERTGSHYSRAYVVV